MVIRVLFIYWNRSLSTIINDNAHEAYCFISSIGGEFHLGQGRLFLDITELLVCPHAILEVDAKKVIPIVASLDRKNRVIDR